MKPDIEKIDLRSKFRLSTFVDNLEKLNNVGIKLKRQKEATEEIFADDAEDDEEYTYTIGQRMYRLGVFEGAKPTIP